MHPEPLPAIFASFSKKHFHLGFIMHDIEERESDATMLGQTATACTEHRPNVCTPGQPAFSAAPWSSRSFSEGAADGSIVT